MFGHIVMLARCSPFVNAHFKASAAWLQAMVPNATSSLGHPTGGDRRFRSVNTRFSRVVVRTVELRRRVPALPVWPLKAWSSRARRAAPSWARAGSRHRQEAMNGPQRSLADTVCLFRNIGVGV